MQRAFVDLAYPPGAATGAAAVDAVTRLLSVARGAAVPVYFTVSDTGARCGRPVEQGRWKSLPEPGTSAVGDPPGEEIVEALKPLENEVVIDKGSRPSAFFGTPLASYLVHQSCDTVIVAGITTSGCVRATVLDAFQYNFRCILPFECSADRSQISHKVTLFDLHMKYADVVSLDQAIGYLRRIASGAE